jgi:hypothetical protein
MMWKRSRIRLGMNSKEVLENDVIGNFVCTIFKLTHHPKLAEHLVGGAGGYARRRSGCVRGQAVSGRIDPMDAREENPGLTRVLKKSCASSNGLPQWLKP